MLEFVIILANANNNLIQYFDRIFESALRL